MIVQQFRVNSTFFDYTAAMSSHEYMSMISLQHPPAVSCPSDMIPWIFDPLGVFPGTAVRKGVSYSPELLAFWVRVVEVYLLGGTVNT